MKTSPLRSMYDNSQYIITSYIPLYYIKYWTQGIYSDAHGDLDVNSYRLCM